MRNILHIILISLFISCDKCHELDANFRSTVIEYQNEFPIPRSTKRPRIFIYHAAFYKNKNDTMFLLSRIGSGINNKRFKGYGVFEDKVLKPFIVLDEKDLSHSFVLNKKREVPEKLIWNSQTFPENCTPLYRYVVKNKKFKLVKIDTIWMHWE